MKPRIFAALNTRLITKRSSSIYSRTPLYCHTPKFNGTCFQKNNQTNHLSTQKVQSRLFSTSSTKMAPSKSEIETLFKNLETGNPAAFMEHVSPNVDWTVMGTHPCAGRYTSLADFQQATFARLGAIMKPPGIRLMIRNVIGGGEGEWATVEMVADAECTNGFKFDNTYAWCCRFDGEGTIVQVRAYLDSWMVKEAIEENEGGNPESHRAPMPKLG